MPQLPRLLTKPRPVPCALCPIALKFVLIGLMGTSTRSFWLPSHFMRNRLLEIIQISFDFYLPLMKSWLSDWRLCFLRLPGRRFVVLKVHVAFLRAPEAWNGNSSLDMFTAVRPSALTYALTLPLSSAIKPSLIWIANAAAGLSECLEFCAFINNRHSLLSTSLLRMKMTERQIEYLKIMTAVELCLYIAIITFSPSSLDT